MGADDQTRPRQRSARPLPLRAGDRVRDYVVEELIGQGGFGTIYRVRHVILDRGAALKVLHADLVGGDALIRFEREARVVNQIQHPNVVDVFDFGELPGGVPYFVMELLRGHDLAVLLAMKRRFAPDELLEILHPLASALATAHGHGIVHRDIKASNVVIDPGRDRGRVVLLDFGVAKLLEPDGGGITSTRQAVGSPCSSAPEQVEGRAIDARTDVYGLAVLAFQLLTGGLPFPSALPAVAQFQHLTSPRPHASTRAPLAPAFDDVLARGMAIRPGDRQSGTQELVAELAAAISEHAAIVAAPANRQPVVAVTTRLRPTGAVDETMLRHLDAIDALAADWLRARGFRLVRELDRGAVHVFPLDADPATAAVQRDTAIAVAGELAVVLAADAGDDPRVEVTVASGDADLHGGVIWSGPLIDPDPAGSDPAPVSSAPGAGAGG